MRPEEVVAQWGQSDKRRIHYLEAAAPAEQWLDVAVEALLNVIVVELVLRVYLGDVHEAVPGITLERLSGRFDEGSQPAGQRPKVQYLSRTRPLNMRNGFAPNFLGDTMLGSTNLAK